MVSDSLLPLPDLLSNSFCQNFGFLRFSRSKFVNYLFFFCLNFPVFAGKLSKLWFFNSKMVSDSLLPLPDLLSNSFCQNFGFLRFSRSKFVKIWFFFCLNFPVFEGKLPKFWFLNSKLNSLLPLPDLLSSFVKISGFQGFQDQNLLIIRFFCLNFPVFGKKLSKFWFLNSKHDSKLPLPDI